MNSNVNYTAKRVISFDAGLKNMGVCVIDYILIHDNQTVKNVNDVKTCKWLADNIIKIIYLDKWDISKFAKKRNDFVGFAKGLKEKLIGIQELEPFDTVLYEHQMNANHRTNVITDFIIYHFVGKCENIVRVPGASKSTVYFSPSLKYQNFASRYSSNYTANKKHTELNMKYWYNMHDLNLPKCKLDDMADAFMLGVAYILFK